MTASIVRAIAAALLLGAGWVCWTAAQLQARLTEANRQVLMLRYSGSLGEYDDIEQSLGHVGRLPTTMLADLHEQRATAQYWDSLYGDLSLARDASGNPIESDPDVLFLAANAAYRAGQRAGADRVATVRALEAAIAGYAEVIKKSPAHVDAAYNLEYAVRERDAVARSRERPRAKPDGRSMPPAGERAVGPNDLPAGPTIDGQPGGPPADTDMKQFKVLAPMRPDEREATPDKAGENKRPLRKG
jgi:hypothetical protein